MAGKQDLINMIAEKSGLTKKDSEKALLAYMDTIKETLARNEKVQLVGFGNYEVRERAERKGRNPKTQEEITIPASKAPVFKFAKGVKEELNK